MTASHLLSTKFLVPRPSPDHLLRSHLSDRLERAALHKRLTLLSAPPGYGKTTLLVELVGRGAMPCAWLQLDPTDSDPNVFLTCLVEAVRRMHGLETQERLHEFGASALALLENSGANAAVAPERILTVLINELSDVQDTPWFFVFEDYHLVANPVVHNLMNMLMEQGPAEMHVIASSRVDPPLALARLRARGQLEELRVPELRFSAGEVRARVEQAERLPKLSDADVALLHEKTEGWAAALQIVLSSLANADTQSAESIHRALERHPEAYIRFSRR